jgi:hypothetical protein
VPVAGAAAAQAAKKAADEAAWEALQGVGGGTFTGDVVCRACGGAKVVTHTILSGGTYAQVMTSKTAFFPLCFDRYLALSRTLVTTVLTSLTCCSCLPVLLLLLQERETIQKYVCQECQETWRS